MEPKIKDYPWTLLLICCLGFALRIYHLNTYSLWCDEMLQVTSALSAWKELFYSFIWHSSPPLDYVLMKLSILLFGKADWAVRLPAFLFGFASIPLFYFFSRSIAGQKTALVAAVLLAFSPMAISYSQEARMYSLFLFLALASYIATIRFARNNSFTAGLVWGGINGLIILAHYFGIFVIAYETVVLLCVLWHSDEKKRRLELLAVNLLISFFLFLSWLPIFLTQVGIIWEAGYALHADGYFFENIFSRFTVDAAQLNLWVWAYFFVFFGSIAIAWRRKEKSMLLVTVSMFGILGALFTLSFFKQIVTPRNVIFVLPFFLLICAYGIRAASEYLKINFRIVLISIVLLAAWPATSYHLSAPKGHKQPWKNAIQYIQQNSSGGEKIFTTDAVNRSFLSYYGDPEADYRVMGSYWRIFKNKPSWKIWVINDTIVKSIQEKRLSGWIVIPSYFMGGARNSYFQENYRQLLGVPAKTFTTQAGPLQIFHLRPE